MTSNMSFNEFFNGSDLLIVWSLTPFSTSFRLHHIRCCISPLFPKFLFTIALHNILSEPLPAFPNNHRQHNGKQWIGMNVVAKTWKGYWSDKG